MTCIWSTAWCDAPVRCQGSYRVCLCCVCCCYYQVELPYHTLTLVTHAMQGYCPIRLGPEQPPPPLPWGPGGGGGDSCRTQVQPGRAHKPHPQQMGSCSTLVQHTVIAVVHHSIVIFMFVLNSLPALLSVPLEYLQLLARWVCQCAAVVWLLFGVD